MKLSHVGWPSTCSGGHIRASSARPLATPALSSVRPRPAPPAPLTAAPDPRRQDRLETPLTKVQFFWVCRDSAEFETFKGLLATIVEDRTLASVFSLNTYITGELDLKKVAQRGVQDAYHQFAGKPDWRRIGKEMREAHPDKDVGVFLCGPNAIGDQLVAMCEQYNPKRNAVGRRPTRAEAGPRFFFHKETF